MNLKISIITVAGVSSRFNKDIPEGDKILKCLYYEENPQNTLIYQMLKKLDYCDKIIIVGGYKYSLKSTRKPNPKLIKKFVINSFKKACDNHALKFLPYCRNVANVYRNRAKNKKK